MIPPPFPQKEYIEAISRQNFVRDAAFLRDESGRPLTENICGFEVRQMSMLDFFALRLVRSPFLVGGEPNPEDVRAFLWRLSPNYTHKNCIERGRFMKRCRVFLPPLLPLIKTKGAMDRWGKRTLAALDHLGNVLAAIRLYVAESLQDWGASGKGGIPHYSDAVSTVGMLARDYGWSEDAILNMPMKRALQYRKEILNANGQKAAMFNPSDRISFEWLRERNKN